jgi:hypothetical protein
MKLLWKTFIKGFEHIERITLSQRADGRFVIQAGDDRSIKCDDYETAAAELGRVILSTLAAAGEISFKYSGSE